MTYDQLPDEWKEWLGLSPLERFVRGERMLVEYIAMGGSPDPAPDPTSPFDVPAEWRPLRRELEQFRRDHRNR